MNLANALGCFLCFGVMGLLLVLAGQTMAEDLTIDDKDWRLKERIQDGKIYDWDCNLKGRIDKDRIYDRNWKTKGYIGKGK